MYYLLYWEFTNVDGQPFNEVERVAAKQEMLDKVAERSGLDSFIRCNIRLIRGDIRA